MALKPYIVDDSSADDVLLVWAASGPSAKAIARREHAPPQKDYWGYTIQKPWEAQVYQIRLPGVVPPDIAGLETRQEVLDAASEHVRTD